MAGAGHEDPVDGYDIVTTLDLDLQDVADKALRRQLEAQNAIWGTTIVMEVETGEILAMANLGRAGSSGGSYYERENYALGRSMEPGSTFKLATMLTLLDDAGMSPETTYDTHNGDPVTVGPARNIRDSHRGDHVIGFRRAVASSSNVYFAKAIWDRYGITGKNRNTATSCTKTPPGQDRRAGTARRTRPRRSPPTGKYPTRASCSSR